MMCRHLKPGVHKKCEWRNMVYVIKDEVKILFQRHNLETSRDSGTENSEPTLQIHFRCLVKKPGQVNHICS